MAATLTNVTIAQGDTGLPECLMDGNSAEVNSVQTMFPEIKEISGTKYDYLGNEIETVRNGGIRFFGFSDYADYTPITLSKTASFLAIKFSFGSFLNDENYLLGNADADKAGVYYDNVNSKLVIESDTEADYWMNAEALTANTDYILIVNADTSEAKSYLANTLVDTKTITDNLTLSEQINSLVSSDCAIKAIAFGNTTINEATRTALYNYMLNM